MYSLIIIVAVLILIGMLAYYFSLEIIGKNLCEKYKVYLEEVDFKYREFNEWVEENEEIIMNLLIIRLLFKKFKLKTWRIDFQGLNSCYMQKNNQIIKFIYIKGNGRISFNDLDEIGNHIKTIIFTKKSCTNDVMDFLDKKGFLLVNGIKLKVFLEGKPTYLKKFTL